SALSSSDVGAGSFGGASATFGAVESVGFDDGPNGSFPDGDVSEMGLASQPAKKRAIGTNRKRYGFTCRPCYRNASMGARLANARPIGKRPRKSMRSRPAA